MTNKITYYEDGMLLAYSSFNRDKSRIQEKIYSKIKRFDYIIEQHGIVLAYEILCVDKLMSIYNNDVFVVNFAFLNVDRFINKNENVLFEKLIINLNKTISETKGYYIIKIPSNIPMLIEQINKYLDNKIFVGGTVYYAANEIKPLPEINDDVTIIKADKKNIALHRAEIETIAKKSFSSYFGQYHISHFTREKAAEIYLNWTMEGLDAIDTDTLFALHENRVVGFLNYKSSGLCGELILSGVDNNFQGKSIYYRMEHSGCAEIIKLNKIAFTSTQFNNVSVQHVWIKIGLKPYHSFYLFHINNVPNLIKSN